MTVSADRTARLEDLQETSQVLWAVSHAPQVVAPPGWCLDLCGDRWVLRTDNGRPARNADQPTLVGAGSAVEHAVLALASRGHRVMVSVLPTDDPSGLARLEVIGPGPRPTLALVAEPPAPAPASTVVTPSHLRQLNLAAEVFGVEVLWSTELVASYGRRGLQRVHATSDPRPMATLVTHGDDPGDQVAAGRALAHLLLRAAALGLDARVDVHALGRPETRAEVRELWGLREHPQVQLTIDVPGRATD